MRSWVQSSTSPHICSEQSQWFCCWGSLAPQQSLSNSLIARRSKREGENIFLNKKKLQQYFLNLPDASNLKPELHDSSHYKDNWEQEFLRDSNFVINSVSNSMLLVALLWKSSSSCFHYCVVLTRVSHFSSFTFDVHL